MSSVKTVVELTPDSERLVAAFEKIQARDEKLRQGFKQSAEEGKRASKELADAFIKGGSAGTGSIGKLIAELKRSGSVGKFVGKSLDDHLSNVGAGGKRSIEQIIESISRLHPEFSDAMDGWVESARKADQSVTFEATRKEIGKLGGYFETLAAEIEVATADPVEKSITRGKELVAKLREIDPAKAEGIAIAMERAKIASRQAEFDRMVTSLSSGSKEAKSLASAIESEVKRSAFEAAGGIDAMVESAKRLKPEMTSFIDQFRTEWQAAEQQTQMTTLRAELRSLGPEFASLGDEVDKAFAIPLEDARRLRKRNPGRTQVD